MINFKRLFAAALAAAFVLAPFAGAQTKTTPEVPTAAPMPAAAPAPVESAVITEFKVLFAKISAKLESLKEQPTEAALTEEIKEFDALLAKYSAEKTDDVASIHLMKARLYLEVFDEGDKALVILKSVKADFPNTEVGKNLDSIIDAVEKQIASANVLAVGKPFANFTATDLAGKEFSLDAFKGKVVLIDFWATWCGPCVAELPHVQAAYEKYHAKGFEIIGLSLDRERSKLDDFLAKNKMPWTHHLDENGKIAQENGINSIPSTFLLDKEGKIVAKDLRGDALEKELAKLLN
ncbi:TlpA family protein disulfide reductase [Oleiharenicola lentus]|uniref:TlpA family protein disulfide reductase n=1 Tax=Oleiharenicola lentus TaxID=2508720 RepID=UPI003F67B572